MLVCSLTILFPNEKAQTSPFKPDLPSKKISSKKKLAQYRSGVWVEKSLHLPVSVLVTSPFPPPGSLNDTASWNQKQVRVSVPCSFSAKQSLFCLFERQRYVALFFLHTCRKPFFPTSSYFIGIGLESSSILCLHHNKKETQKNFH